VETTVDACFGHLNLLSACYLTLKHLPARTDNRFFTAYGHLVFMDDRLDIILWQLASNASNSSEYYKFLNGNKYLTFTLICLAPKKG
jgi:hypothetical protein